MPSKASEIAAKMQDQIRRGILAPGQRLVEADLISEFGVSRSSLREAMKRLSEAGLIISRHNFGSRVRQLTRENICSIYQAREALEGMAARLAAQRITPSSRNELKGLLSRLKAHSKAGEIEAYLAANTEFHDMIIRISQNDEIGELIEKLTTPIVRLQFRTLINRSIIRQSNDEHEVIAKAIMRKDGDAAEQAIRHHIQGGLALVQSMPDQHFAIEPEAQA